jgi:hypothetical protein
MSMTRREILLAGSAAVVLPPVGDATISARAQHEYLAYRMRDEGALGLMGAADAR